MGCLLQALAWNSVELGKSDLHPAVWKPVVVGLTLMVSTYCFASISGAHLNPAVSFAVGLTNKGQWYSLYKYVIAQFLGCCAGVFISCRTYNKVAAGVAVGPRNEFSMGQVWIVEFGSTALLCLVFLNVTLSRRNNPVKSGNQFYGLAIGLAMLAGVAASEDISGGIFNPALALAVDAQNGAFLYGVSYAVISMMAAFVASVCFRILRPYEGEVDFVNFSKMIEEEKATINAPKLASEGIGTFVVVVAFGLTAMSKTYSMLRPLAAGSALASCHYAMADISGGYFNPAVTLSVMMNGRKKLQWFHGCCYIAVQIVSASCGCVIFQALYSNQFNPMVQEKKLKIHGVEQGYQDVSCIGVICSFTVCYVVLSTQTVKGISTQLSRNTYGGLAYGLASATGGFVVIHLANALTNPALMLGAGFTTSVSQWWSGVKFTTAILDFLRSSLMAASYFIGAVLASIIFRVVHADDFKEHHNTMRVFSFSVDHDEESYDEEAPLMDKADSEPTYGLTHSVESAAAKQGAEGDALAAQLAAQKAASDRALAEMAEQEEKAAEQAEATRLALAEKALSEELAREKEAAEQVAAEKAAQDNAAETARLAAEEAAEKKAIAEQNAQEKKLAEEETAEAEATKLAAEEAAEETAIAEKNATEKAMAGKLAEEEAAQEQAVAENAAQEKAAAEKVGVEQAAADNAEQEEKTAEKEATEQAEDSKLAVEKAGEEEIANKLTSEEAAAEKVVAEKTVEENVIAENLATEKAAAEQVAEEKAAQEKAAAEKAAAEQAAVEQVEQEKTIAEKEAVEQAETPRLAAEEAAEERAIGEKLAVEKAAAEQADETGQNA
jgi:glycerol uptake facilitator-like aquaporin